MAAFLKNRLLMMNRTNMLLLEVTLIRKQYNKLYRVHLWTPVSQCKRYIKYELLLHKANLDLFKMLQDSNEPSYDGVLGTSLYLCPRNVASKSGEKC